MGFHALSVGKGEEGRTPGFSPKRMKKRKGGNILSATSNREGRVNVFAGGV